ncbi:hypothetical protein IEQ34_008102 [Dendrobium chrysotoxum]|uniref:Uncharacterized protein n=1 Tax=Dendrobium chrysotoxum TaxID=161865 RepID=A0AAV7H7N4_DENCH|nr:hypothetical protein IEQ34_008102 [Dendrobium chrysotoxum]
MGKTTLLQHVYEDVTRREFNLKMWVCVSNNFDAKKVIADMLECLKKERPRLETLGQLQGGLKQKVMSKKFLLMLDDIWEEDEEKDKSKWEDVLAPLASGAFGSKILVTTRTDSVALMFAKVFKKKGEIVKLEGLEEDECLQLLNSHAFAGVENPNDHEILRGIARDIVKKLSRSPLEAKVIGGVLNSLDLDERRWRTVLESNLLGQNSINSILRLSYIVLPNHLQNCFAFCCMFPQDFTFDKDDLVRMWIALGFIQPSQGMTTEDIGGRNFDVLVKKTLFDKVGGHYKMPRVIHESASKFFAQECDKLVDDDESSLKISETIRHLSVQICPNILRKIEKFKYLRSLFLFYEASDQDLCSALIEIFKVSRCLRLLYIHTDELTMIPEEIRYLKHLRYLKIKRLESVDATRLPRSLSNLYHLQYIIYDPWVSIRPEVDDFLPSDINNLSNLCYVKLPENYISSICGIGKLKSLQELDMFDLRDVNGYKIGELENMNELCKLGINCLEHVTNAEAACSAKLRAKRRLTDLTLRWSTNTDSRNFHLDEIVLDNLQPPKCLRNLSIERYMGARSAIWMNDVNLLSNIEKIEEIELSYCMEWKTLPPFGQLPFLKSLKLFGVPAVKWLESKFNGNDRYHPFPSLVVLHINCLMALEDWFEAGVAAEDGSLFPCLIELKLRNCPKLKDLLSLPSKLKSLEIENIGCTNLNFGSFSNSIPLETVKVFDCPNITSLPLADEIARLAALRSLTITKCPNLISLGRYREVEMLSDLSISDPLVLLMEPLRSVASLKKLTIELNDELVSFTNAAAEWFRSVSSSLCELEFRCLKSLQSLPSSLESLSSLQKLFIDDVPMLRELPNLPPSLQLKILVTTRMDSIALTFAKVIKKEIVRLEGLEEDECLQFLNTHAFADVENLNDLKKLRAIAGELVKMLSGSPLEAKVIVGVLISNLDERHWMKVLKSNFRTVTLGQNYIFSILRLSPKFLSNPLKTLFLLLFTCSALTTSIVGAMAELVVGPIMEKIINACSDYLEEQVGWQTGMKEELGRLRENHPKIQAVVLAANQAQLSDQNPALNKWIWQLRDAIDEAHDVLDEFEYMKHKEQLPQNTEETKLTVRSMLKSMKKRFVKIGERGLGRDPNLKRLEDAVKKLDKVSADVTAFLYLLDSVKQERQEQQLELYNVRETGSFPKNGLIGRGKHKEFVIQWLRMPSNEEHQALVNGTDLCRKISLLSIVGHGGMGKTTLLQHVYDDEMTKEVFDLRMWVCVSNNFDVKKVIADMLESLKKKRPRWETLDALQDSLKNLVKYKKFLLVLDDVWEEEEERDTSKWEDVLAPLASGGFGSKILVTTRTDSIALMFAKVIKKKKEMVKLEGLEEDACLQLLNSHAFAGVENPPDDHKKLRAIAGEIVKKLLGSPLAAKVIGGVLNVNLDERHWRKVLESNLLGQNSVDSILRLSYIVLSNPLKSCFAFCGMFAQDHSFFKDDLVRMWIALGFIQPSNFQGETLEDIGGRYFDVLVKKSFFDRFELTKNFSYYKMHDLLHELAQSVFEQECLRVEDGIEFPSMIPVTLRHLSIQTTDLDILRRIGKFKHLHSLFLYCKDSNQDLCNALIEIFQASRSLRLLCIWAPKDLEIILEEIGNLIHLRYLKIDGYNLTMLPRSLSNLYHLQYIICDCKGGLSQPKVDDFLPSDINNLSNLRYVKLPVNCISSICGIGKLNSLQELDMFDLRNEMGYRIDELKYLNDLCKLGINCLENVKDVEEARNAQLCEKRRLTDLTLNWRNTDSRNNDLDENVLDNLQPQNCLKNLSIWSYMGARSAIWMNNVNPIFNLEKIELRYCNEWETLPPFGQLPFLKCLTLSKMPKVKWLQSKFNGNDKCHAFPLLEELYIRGLEALEDWFEEGVAAEDGCLFPCLIELVLFKCPKLKELPSLPPKLKSLQIEKTGWTTLNFCSNSNPIPLETLKVSNCQNITSLYLADETARLAALRYLTITNCPNLISLGRYREVETTNNCHLVLSSLNISDPSVLLMEPLRSIASLEMLSIMENDELVSFSNEVEQWFLRVRSSLSNLEFAKLKSLQSSPSSLESLSSLQKLSFYAVPMLRKLPNLPPSLKSLSIWGCHPELKERYLKDVGSDWHKIDHIPRILI